MRRTAILVLVGALALAGCGSDKKEETVQAPAQSGSTAMPAMGGGDHSHGGADANASCTPSGTTLSISVQNIKFNTDCLAAPADQPFTLNYDNKDSVAHNLVLLESHTATQVMFRAEIFQGPANKTFPNIGPFKAGTYAFHCEVHPNQMFGTFVVK